MSLHAVTEPETAAIARQKRHARAMRYRFMVISRLRMPGKPLTRPFTTRYDVLSWFAGHLGKPGCRDVANVARGSGANRGRRHGDKRGAPPRYSGPTRAVPCLFSGPSCSRQATNGSLRCSAGRRPRARASPHRKQARETGQSPPSKALESFIALTRVDARNDTMRYRAARASAPKSATHSHVFALRYERMRHDCAGPGRPYLTGRT